VRPARRVSETGRVSVNSLPDERHPRGNRGGPRRRGKVSFRSRVLPWSASSDDDVRFRRIAERVLIACALFFIAIPWLPVRQPDRTQPQVLSAPMAKLLLSQEEKPKPPPPPVKAKIEPLPKQVEVQVASNKPDRPLNTATVASATQRARSVPPTNAPRTNQ